MGVKDNYIYEECMKELNAIYGERPTLGKNFKGFKDLTHTNMCYRCDYCDQGFNQIFSLNQLAVEYYICDRCVSYYKLTTKGLEELRYVENRQEWNDASWFPSKLFFPYPIGFDE
jgi:hypothetical protein